jgi:hypothetical protein
MTGQQTRNETITVVVVEQLFAKRVKIEKFCVLEKRILVQSTSYY